MHDEDKRNGLLVRNIRGDTWWAYGDANFFDERNAQNVAMVAEAAQISRNEIWSAFQGAVDVFGAVNLIPDVNLTATACPQCAEENVCSMFLYDESTHTLKRRSQTTLRPPDRKSAV